MRRPKTDWGAQYEMVAVDELRELRERASIATRALKPTDKTTDEPAWPSYRKLLGLIIVIHLIAALWAIRHS